MSMTMTIGGGDRAGGGREYSFVTPDIWKRAGWCFLHFGAAAQPVPLAAVVVLACTLYGYLWMAESSPTGG